MAGGWGGGGGLPHEGDRAREGRLAGVGVGGGGGRNDSERLSTVHLLDGSQRQTRVR